MTDITQTKYRELAEHARDLLFRQQDRFARIDQKAAVHFSAISVLVGIAGFLGKWVVAQCVPLPFEAGWWRSSQWWLLAAMVGMFALVASAWMAFYQTIKVTKYDTLALNEEVLQFCQGTSRVQFNYYLAKRSTEAHAQVCAAANRKSKWLNRGYHLSFGALIMCAVRAVIYTWNQWATRAHQEGNPTVSMIIIGGDEDSTPNDDGCSAESPQAAPPPEPSEPDPNIEGPENISVTEGYEPSEMETKDISDGQ